MRRTQDLLSRQLSYIAYSSGNYIYHVVHHIPIAYLSYYWKSVPFDHFHQIFPSLPAPPLATTNLISFSMNLVVFEV